MSSTVFLLLAVAGAAALFLRLFRSAGRVALRAAEAAAASGIAKNSAMRGDVTRMQEGQEIERRAKAARRRATGAAAFWLLWLAVPLALGHAREAYAVAASLWLLPGGRKATIQKSDETGGRMMEF